MGFSRQDYWSGLPFPSPGFKAWSLSCLLGESLNLLGPQLLCLQDTPTPTSLNFQGQPGISAKCPAGGQAHDASTWALWRRVLTSFFLPFPSCSLAGQFFIFIIHSVPNTHRPEPYLCSHQLSNNIQSYFIKFCSLNRVLQRSLENSLAVQWLELWDSTAEGNGLSLIGELRPQKLRDMNPPKKEKFLSFILTWYLTFLIINNH